MPTFTNSPAEQAANRALARLFPSGVLCKVWGEEMDLFAQAAWELFFFPSLVPFKGKNKALPWAGLHLAWAWSSCSQESCSGLHKGLRVVVPVFSLSSKTNPILWLSPSQHWPGES